MRSEFLIDATGLQTIVKAAAMTREKTLTIFKTPGAVLFWVESSGVPPTAVAALAPSVGPGAFVVEMEGYKALANIDAGAGTLSCSYDDETGDFEIGDVVLKARSIDTIKFCLRARIDVCAQHLGNFKRSPFVSAELLSDLERTIGPAISKDESRCNLCHVHAKADGEIEATDGHRMHFYRREGLYPLAEPMLVSGLAARIACRIHEQVVGFNWIIGEKPGNNDRNVAAHERVTGFEFVIKGSATRLWVLAHSPEPTDYPDSAQIYGWSVIDKTMELHIGETRAALKDARSVLGKDWQVALDFTGGVTLNMANSQGKVVRKLSHATWSGDALFKMGFNAGYLDDILKASVNGKGEDDTITCRITEELLPMGVAHGDFRAVLMPVRV